MGSTSGQLWIAAVWTFVFAFERWAELLNLHSAQNPLPEELSSIQPPEEHQKAFNYLSDRTRPAWLRETLMFIGFLGMLFLGGFGLVYQWSIQISENVVIQGLIFGAILSILQGIISLPFSYHSTFVIEEKYGFNRTTLKTFIGDLIKGVLVGSILGGLLFWFAVSFFAKQGPNAWLMIWAGYAVFQVFITWIAPVTLLPLFMKLTPLFDGELKDGIEKYSKDQNFKLDGVWVCDASKRSAKSNAFFTGFGKFRRLVLFDTLITKHPASEIVSVVAHEAGHFKLGHIWKSSVFSLATSFLLLWMVQKLIDSPELYLSFGIFPPHIGVGLILALMVLGKGMFFFQFISSAFSRKNEFEADRFSLKTYPQPEALISALKRLTTDNLAILNPHPLYVKLFASHPPLVQRMQAIRALIK